MKAKALPSGGALPMLPEKMCSDRLTFFIATDIMSM